MHPEVVWRRELVRNSLDTVRNTEKNLAAFTGCGHPIARVAQILGRERAELTQRWLAYRDAVKRHGAG